MKFVHKLMAVGAMAASVILPAEAKQGSYRNDNSPYFQAHVELARTIEQTGIDFQLNPPECGDNPNTYGWYYSAGKQLVVCQVNAKTYNWGEYPWTSEDLDTLRHEAHHLVQDCAVDRSLNGQLHALYERPDEVIKNELEPRYIMQIVEAYKDTGDYHTFMELEAFAVAHMDDAPEQIRDIQNYCL